MTPEDQSAPQMTKQQALIKLYETGEITKEEVMSELSEQHRQGELNEKQAILFKELAGRQNGGLTENE